MAEKRLPKVLKRLVTNIEIGEMFGVAVIRCWNGYNGRRTALLRWSDQGNYGVSWGSLGTEEMWRDFDGV